VSFVAVVHVLAENEREAVDEFLHGRGCNVEDAHAALFGEYELARAGGRSRVVGRGFGIALAHAASWAIAAAGGGAVTCARSARSRYQGRRLSHAGAMLP